MFREALYAVRHEAKQPPKNYAEEIEKADIEKLTRLIKIAAVLLQTKVYLFWSRKKKNEN